METLRPTQALKIAYELLKEHGLIDWSVTLDQALTRAGQCRFTQREISLSKPLMADLPADQTRDTITHEIAHALVGPAHGHDAVWVAAHRRLGGSGERCFAYNDTASPWVGTCAHGRETARYRAPKRLEGWRCRCSSGSSPVVWTKRT